MRLTQHNSNYFKKGYTKAAKDWEIIYFKLCQSKEQAVFLERSVKRMKSSAFIKKTIENPEILDGIWSESK